MRPLRGCALATAALLALGCGGDGDNGGIGPQNQPPTAAFDQPSCAALSCTFTDGSSDPDGQIASRSWTFESGTPSTSTDAAPVVTFPAAGTYAVTLTVTDDDGASDDATLDAVVGEAPPGNQPPVAAFDVQCDGLACTFTSTSTDADGTIAAHAWDFGEPASPDNTSTEANPSHTYSATDVTDFTVTLTVTDDLGAEGTHSETITVTPPAGLQCSSGDELVNCTLDVTEKATLTITLTSRDCQFAGNRFEITSPIQQTVFTDGCTQPVGTVYPLEGPSDGAFEAGTKIEAQFTQGVGDPEDPPRGPPATRVEGSFPAWTISIDDGGNVGIPGEPDFNDLVLTVEATPTP